MKTDRRLSPEDQAKVDEFISSGYNSVERRPFRPFRLLLVLWVVVSLLGIVAWVYAKYLGLV